MNGLASLKLPTSIEIGGVDYVIRYDFRAIIDILLACVDPEIPYDECRATVMLDIFYEDFQNIPKELHEEAIKKAVDFIDMGIKDDGRKVHRKMDWEQDAPLIVSAVNPIIGHDVRRSEPTHWWTFLSAFLEIRESLFSEIVSIRSKLSRGEKLEKAERQFYKENRTMVNLKSKYTAQEDEILKEWLS